jgi:hypothetical protein
MYVLSSRYGRDSGGFGYHGLTFVFRNSVSYKKTVSSLEGQGHDNPLLIP